MGGTGKGGGRRGEYDFLAAGTAAVDEHFGYVLFVYDVARGDFGSMEVGAGVECAGLGERGTPPLDEAEHFWARMLGGVAVMCLASWGRGCGGAIFGDGRRELKM